MVTQFTCPKCRAEGFIDDEIPSDVNVRCKACGSLFVAAEASVPWYEDRILRYCWIIPAAILVPFFVYLASWQIYHAGSQVAEVLRCIAESAVPVLLVLVIASIGAIAVLAAVVAIGSAVPEQNRGTGTREPMELRRSSGASSPSWPFSADFPR